eukprot:gb/GECH01011863.1/.p1 GENE.gb/GECH01011863.1/~~gb/GECH01011863.1/.p1  ORF type:complete len:164 (+),score=46.54 gb/GECH01011863.1/:1-492(+)
MEQNYHRPFRFLCDMYLEHERAEEEEDEAHLLHLIQQLNGSSTANLYREQQRNLADVDPELLRLSMSDRDFDENDYELLLRLDDSVEKKGVSQESRKNCLTHFAATKCEGKCHICLEQMDTKEKLIRVDKCTHTYHDECLSKWIDSHKTCPICRFEISEEDSR